MDVPLGSMSFEEFQNILSFEIDSIISDIEKKHNLKALFKCQEDFNQISNEKISYENLKNYEKMLQQNMYLENDALQPT